MANKTALILIDIQKGCNANYYGKRNNSDAEKNISLILTTFRSKKMAIYHIQHLSTIPQSPLSPDQPGVAFMDFVRPLNDEYIFQKHVSSAFIDTQLHVVLKKNQINTLIFVGIATDHCVSSSIRMASDLGFKAIVVADAIITFGRTGFDGVYYDADIVQAITLASLHNEFATVMNTIDLIKTIY